VEELQGSHVTLTPADSHHALRSLRLRVGEPVSLADGKGRVARGRLAREEQGRAVIEVEDVSTVSLPTPAVSVAMANPGWDRMRWAVQKLAELGTSEVLVIDSERSARSSAREPAVDRLNEVARQAAMQSRQPFVTAVRGGYALSPGPGKALPVSAGGLSLVMLWEKATASLTECLPPQEATGVRLLVGPEGGFTQEEAKAAGKKGTALASLGPNILRTETAAIVGAALVLARYGRLG
jgi:16S rRNA (uracil1498-N3)-methyltransferase